MTIFTTGTFQVGTFYMSYLCCGYDADHVVLNVLYQWIYTQSSNNHDFTDTHNTSNKGIVWGIFSHPWYANHVPELL